MILQEAILAALAYHDIFDYPLTVEEIHRYLIKKASLKSVRGDLDILCQEKKIGTSQGFYFLKNRSLVVKTRIKRSHFSHNKLKRASIYSKLLTLIPTIKLVAISGALAMQNSHKQDDIDLVIVTSKNTLWTTRFLANFLLFPFKRSPTIPSTIHLDPQRQRGLQGSVYSPLTNNKVCLNLFLDEKDLKIKSQNLYTAHEICQLKPLFNRNKTYSRLIKSNQWMSKYLPNWTQNAERLTTNDKKGSLRKALVLRRLALVVENLLKEFQIHYMKSKITTEKIGETQLFFHPQDAQDWVIKEYQSRLKRLKILPVDN